MRGSALASILLVLILALSGCGGKKSTPTPTMTSETTTSTPAPTTTTTPPPTTTTPPPTTTSPTTTTTPPPTTTTTAPPGPQVTFSVDEAADRLKVVSPTATTADWNRLAIKLKTQTGAATINMGNSTAPFQNEPASKSDAANDILSTNYKEITSEADTMSVGDYLAFCVSSSATNGLNVELTVRDTPSDRLVANYTFATIAVCPPLTFQLDDGTDKLKVTAAGADADWDRLAVRLVIQTGPATAMVNVGNTPRPFQNEAAGAGDASNNLPDDATVVEITDTYARIRVDDYIQFCKSGAGDVTNVQLKVIDTGTNEVVYEDAIGFFQTLAPCP